MNENILLNRPAIRGHELRHGIEAFAHHLCSGLGLRPVSIQWTGGISTAAINASGAMYLAMVRDDALIRRADVLRYLGFVVHELLHRKFTDFAAEPRGSEPRVLRVLHNAIEDAWIERKAIRSGLLGNIEALLAALLRGIVDQSMAEVKDWTDPKLYPFALAVTCRAYPGITVPVAQGLAPIFHEASTRIDACQSSTDTLEVARWVLAQLQNLPQQQQDQQQDQQPGNQSGEQPGGEPGEQSGDQSGQQQGEQSGEQGDQPGEQSGDQQGNEPGQQQGGQSGEQQGEQDSPGPARSMQGDEQAREVEPTLDAPAGAEGRGAFNSKREIKKPGAHLGKSSAIMVPSINSPRLEVEVRKLFEDSGSTLFTLNRRNGSVNPAALARVGTTDRLFKQRRDIEGIDSAVVIVLDISGSMFMRANRIRAALAACTLLHRVLTRAGVAVSVLTFGDTASVTVPWSTPTAKVPEILGRLQPGDNTNDSAALRYAHDMLLARPEARKVCFSITDGNGNVFAAADQVKAGEALGITTIGVGIQLDVSRVYPRNVRVTDLDALATASLKQIKLAA